MELSKLTFVGTPEELASVAHLFVGSHADANSKPRNSETSAVSSLGEPEVEEQLILKVLNRLPIPSSQSAIFRSLYSAGDKGLTRSELAAAVKRSDRGITGDLGALGRRINLTDGVDPSKHRGISLLFNMENQNQEWRYWLKPIVRSILERQGIVQAG